MSALEGILGLVMFPLKGYGLSRFALFGQDNTKELSVMSGV